jgi:hypothetical protein
MNHAPISPKNPGGQRPFHSDFAIMFTASLLLAGVLICCSPFAQNRRPVPEAKTADQIIMDMKKWLGLTGEQGGKIRPIIEEQVKKRNELIKKYQGQGRQDMDALKYELQDLRISTEKQLQYFLTNEEMIEYGKMQQEEDQRITKGEMPGEEGQKKPKGRGRRPGYL